METITLYYREGPSDKVYQASIQSKDDGYHVHFAYGRRGSTLNTGSKTPKPVEFQIAKGIYDKLVREKTAKGYRPGADTPIQVPVEDPKQPSGIQCQLLNPIEEKEAALLLFNPAYWMQEKMDGRRLLIRKQGDVITGINRLGFITSVPEPILASAAKYPGDFIIDGEAVGDMLHAFDLLLFDADDLRSLGFSSRYLKLRDLLGEFDHPHIRIVDARFPPQAAGWFSQIQSEGKEGVVFKHVDAPYTPGRPNSGGPQLKYKFYETASFIVASVNPKRSVSLNVFEGNTARPAGNVTIPPNHEVPAPGDIVEVRYLYAFRESGCIYQPVYQGPRDDIEPSACTANQLKFKPALTA
jgi:bifunctional non-homologous end joining protein LigD